MDKLIDKLYEISVKAVDEFELSDGMDILDIIKRMKETNKRLEDSRIALRLETADSLTVNTSTKLYNKIYEQLDYVINSILEQFKDLDNEDSWEIDDTEIDIEDNDIKCINEHIDLMNKFIDAEMVD